VLVALTFAAPDKAFAQNEPPNANLRTVVVTGDALVRRAPDQARVSIAVETRAKASRDAQRQNAEATSAVQKQLAAAGFGKEMLRTAAYSLQQEFDYVQGKQVSRGYLARNMFEVRVDDVSKVGDVLDLAAAAGATTIGGVQFDLKDRDAVEREALRQAVADARARADAAASGAGVSLERIVKIEDHRESRIEPARSVMFARSEAAAPATPIEPGVIEIRAHVTLTVAIR